MEKQGIPELNSSDSIKDVEQQAANSGKWSNLTDEELQEGIVHRHWPKQIRDTDAKIASNERREMIRERHLREGKIRDIEEIKGIELQEGISLFKDLTYYELLEIAERENLKILAPYQGITASHEDNEKFLTLVKTGVIPAGKYWYNNGDGLNSDEEGTDTIDLEAFVIRDDHKDNPGWYWSTEYANQILDALLCKASD